MSEGTEFLSIGGDKKVTSVPGWFERKEAWPPNFRSFEAYADHVAAGGTPFANQHRLVRNRLLFAGYVRTFLEQRRVPMPVSGPMFDICTGDAILPRTFKALGLCSEAHGIDFEGGEAACSDDDMVAYWTGARTMVAEDKSAYLQEYLDEIDFNNVGSILYEEFDAGRVSMDDYRAADFVREPPEQCFPLITLVDGLSRFDVDALFDVVSRTLETDGTFFTCNRYFYGIWGGKHLPMDAPWLHGRLSTEEFLDYYDVTRPELAGHVRKILTDKTTHATPEYYREAAGNHGLELIGYERTINVGDLRTLVFESAPMAEFIRAEVLPQCQEVNPRVTLDDLFTDVLTMVFRKPA